MVEHTPVVEHTVLPTPMVEHTVLVPTPVVEHTVRRPASSSQSFVQRSSNFNFIIKTAGKSDACNTIVTSIIEKTTS